MKKVKRVLALTGVVLLTALYLATLISAIFSTPATGGLFKACIFSTVVVPVMLYAYLLIYRVLKQRGAGLQEKEEPKQKDASRSISQAARMNGQKKNPD